MSLSLFLIASILVSNQFQTCTTPAEEYAVEAVIPDYSLEKVAYIGELTPSGYAYRSTINDKFITILNPTSNPHGLSVRIQTPVNMEEKTTPHFEITTSSISGILRSNIPPLVFGWSTSCNSEGCAFEKQDIRIEATSSQYPEAKIQISKPLNACSEGCSGICLQDLDVPVCIDLRTKLDIETILSYANLTRSLNEALDSYRVISSGVGYFEAVPVVNNSISWADAMDSELRHLVSEGAISITEDDINSIVSKARRGQAGTVYRIVYDNTTSRWMYYNQVENATLEQNKDCRSYTIQDEEDNPLTSPQKLFYLFPIILAISASFLFVVLIFIARLLTKGRKI